MSDSPPSYTCGSCGRSYGARPIHCECGARFDRDGLTRVQAQGGALGVDVLRVGEPAALPFVPCEPCAATLLPRLQAGVYDLSVLCALCRARYGAVIAATRPERR